MRHGLIDWAKAMFGWTAQVVARRNGHRFVVLPKCWIVVRTFAWLNHFCRLAKDYDILPTVVGDPISRYR